MISLLISELVQMTSIWSLNKANQAPDTWNFYQCVHIIWLRYELSRGEESPEASGTSQAWSAAHKSILAGQGHTWGLRTLISKWQGWEGFYTRRFSWLLISRWLVATGEMKNKFPLRVPTGSLELNGELHAQESEKKQQPKTSSPAPATSNPTVSIQPYPRFACLFSQEEGTDVNSSTDCPELISALKSSDPAY